MSFALRTMHFVLGIVTGVVLAVAIYDEVGLGFSIMVGFWPPSIEAGLNSALARLERR